jgi:Domain of unknown function (DUF5063)
MRGLMDTFSDPELGRVDAFRHDAERYCAAIEGTSDTTLGSFLALMQECLPALLTDALQLPDVWAGNEDLTPRISTEALAPIRRAIDLRLGRHDAYRDVFDPTALAARDVITGSLADDLGDIYRDLKEGLLAWDTADPGTQRDAVWQWRFGFQSHWGRHLAAALRVIHFLRHVHFVGVA